MSSRAAEWCLSWCFPGGLGSGCVKGQLDELLWRNVEGWQLVSTASCSHGSGGAHLPVLSFCFCCIEVGCSLGFLDRRGEVFSWLKKDQIS